MTGRPRPRTVSIRDVAELAGVSLGSASRVVNNAQNVTPATREKVTRAIAQLGYRPNHAAQSLRLRSSRTIGCMLTDVTNPLYAKLFRAIEDRFRTAGYMVLLTNGLNNVERELEILATFKSRGMDGVLLAPGNERHPELLAAMETLGIPTVVIDRDMGSTHDRLPCDQVLFDHVPAVRGLVSHLIGLGHRHIALVVAQTPNRPMRRRIEGFRAGFKDHGLPVPEDSIVQLPSSMSPAFSAVSLLLTRAQRPSALITLGTGILNESLNAIHALRLRIPEDISVVALGDPDFARSHVPPLSVVRVDLDIAAEQCATLLLDRIQHGDASGPRSVNIAADFILRQSCGPGPG